MPGDFMSLGSNTEVAERIHRAELERFDGESREAYPERDDAALRADIAAAREAFNGYRSQHGHGHRPEAAHRAVDGFRQSAIAKRDRIFSGNMGDVIDGQIRDAALKDALFYHQLATDDAFWQAWHAAIDSDGRWSGMTEEEYTAERARLEREVTAREAELRGRPFRREALVAGAKLARTMGGPDPRPEPEPEEPPSAVKHGLVAVGHGLFGKRG